MAKLRTRRKQVLTKAPEEGRVRFSAAQSDPEAAKNILGDLSEGASIKLKYRAFRRARLSRISAFHNALYLRVAEKAQSARKSVQTETPENVPEHPKGWYRERERANFYDFLLKFLTVTPKILCYVPQKIAGAFRRASRNLESSYSAYGAVKTFFRRHGGAVLVVFLLGITVGFIAYHASLPLSYSVVIDGENLGFVESRADFDSALSEVENSVSNVMGENFVFPKEVGFSLTKALFPRYLSHTELVQKLSAVTAPYLKVGYALYLDGHFALATDNPSTLQSVLDQTLMEARERTGDETLIALGDQRILYQNAPEQAFFTRSELQKSLVYHIDSATGAAQAEFLLSGEKTDQAVARALSEGEAYRYAVKSEDTQGVKLVIDYGINRTEDIVESIAYHTTYRESDKVYIGAQYVYQRGTLGEKVTSYSVDYSGGKEVARRALAETVSKEPVDQIVLIGTKALPPDTVLDDGSNVVSVTSQRCFITPIYLEKGISSYFGYRSYDNAFHTGLDMPATNGTPVYAAMSGIVVEAGSSGSSYGTAVEILHPNGLYTYYAHLSAVTVHVGDSVSQNQMIGNVGTTGNATGPHVHFEVRLSDGETQVDPMDYLIGMEGGAK